MHLGHRSRSVELQAFGVWLFDIRFSLPNVLWVGLNAARVTNVETKGKAQTAPASLLANIVFRGSHRTLTPLTGPFQVGSGQVNFGCGELSHPVATFNVPAGTREINATAQW
jgi:hypothetical protein